MEKANKKYSIVICTKGGIVALMLSVQEVAKILDVSPRRVRAMIATNMIIAKKVGPNWVITDYQKALIRKPGNPKFNKP